jgi:hypothetical protein
LGGLAGGLVLAALAFHLEHTEIAKGLFLGAILSPIHLLGLNRMTARVLNAGEAKGPGLFRVYYLLRWGSFLLVLGILLAISVECLLGALVSYTWFLLVLAWAGVRGSMREKKTPLSGL